jgi:hypothetical protein
MKHHVEEILRRQGRLQTAASDEAREAFLDLEAAVNARYSDALVRVARWAWSARREHERQRRGS